MRKKFYMLVILLTSLASFSEATSLSGIQFKFFDRDGYPVAGYPIELNNVDISYHPSLSCLITSGAIGYGGGLICGFTKYTSIKTDVSDISGTIALGDQRYSNSSYFTVRLVGVGTPNCANLNASVHTATNEIGLSKSLAITPETLAKIRNESNGVINCVFN